MEDKYYIKHLIQEMRNRAEERNYPDIIDFDAYNYKKEFIKVGNMGKGNNSLLNNDLHMYLHNMENNSSLDYYHPITSFRKCRKAIIIPIKKAIRKMLLWLIKPLMDQQTSFNQGASFALCALADNVEEQSKMQSILLDKNDEYEEAINDIYRQYVMLEMIINKYKSSIQQEIEKIYTDCINRIETRNGMITDILSSQEMQNKKIIDYDDKFKQLIDRGVFDEPKLELYNKKTYSQAGEDTILMYIFSMLHIDITNITYLDLGANHAKEMSNTYYFYQMGSKGVLVEANPLLIPELKFYRSNDIILNKCIDVETGKDVIFYIFNGDGLSTPDYDMAQKCLTINPNLKIVDKRIVETITVNDLIENYIGKSPDFISIDVEGKDFEILESIDFEKYRPKVIITETIKYDTKLAYKTKDLEVTEFMDRKGYDEYAFTGINTIFIDRYLNNLR